MLKEYNGAAVETTTTGGTMGVSDTSVTIAASTGWPSGATAPFVAVLDGNTAKEEKILFESRSGTTLNVAADGRAYDGTSASTHDPGATIVHVLDANTISEANAHVNDDTRDDHSQYLNTTRHDVEARHTFGAAYGTPATPANIGTTASAGSGNNPAKEDHIHEIGTGAIDSAGMFSAGVVDAAAIATDAVGTAEIAAGAVDTAELADNAVTAAKIAADAVGASEIAADSVGTSELAPDAVTATEIAADAVTATEIATDAVTAAKIAANAVTTVKILDLNVTNAKVADATLTTAKVSPVAWTTYVPTWIATGGATILGSGTLSGRYYKIGRHCTFRIFLGIAADTNANTGNFSFALPFQASSVTEQHVQAKMFSALSFNWVGVGYIETSGTTVGPYFPKSAQECNLLPFNQDNPGSPVILGHYTMESGSNMVISGTYETLA